MHMLRPKLSIAALRLQVNWKRKPDRDSWINRKLSSAYFWKLETTFPHHGFILDTMRGSSKKLRRSTRGARVVLVLGSLIYKMCHQDLSHKLLKDSLTCQSQSIWSTRKQLVILCRLNKACDEEHTSGSESEVVQVSYFWCKVTKLGGSRLSKLSWSKVDYIYVHRCI